MNACDKLLSQLSAKEAAIAHHAFWARTATDALERGWLDAARLYGWQARYYLKKFQS